PGRRTEQGQLRYVIAGAHPGQGIAVNLQHCLCVHAWPPRQAPYVYVERPHPQFRTKGTSASLRGNGRSTILSRLMTSPPVSRRARMVTRWQDCMLPLPHGWPRRVRSSVVHAISLAQASLAATRGWASDSLSTSLRRRAEVDRLHQEIR